MPVLMAFVAIVASFTFVGILSKSFRWPVITFFPILWTVLILGVWLGSHEDAVARGYDMSLPSMREKLELYIENNDGDLTDILESTKYAPTFGTR
jgi:hypothetical protein